MEIKKYGDKIYIRADKGDEILRCIMTAVGQLEVDSATFHGIGACGEVTVATYLPEQDDFLDHRRTGLLEMVSLDGNLVTTDAGEHAIHAHAMFSYLGEDNDVHFFGGHLKEAVVSYTAELVLEPVQHGIIAQKKDPITGIDIWRL